MHPLLEKLRQFKLSYSLYNFFKKKELEHNVPLFKKYGLNKKYYSSLSSSDFSKLTPDFPWLDKTSSRIALPAHPVYQGLEEKFQKEIIDWSEKGYAVFPGFFSSIETEQINRETERIVKEGKANWKANNSKIMFAIHQSADIRCMGSNPKLMTILSLLLGREVQLFQSINFLYGSEQRTHSDSIHMSTFPQGYLIAVWVALEDIDEDNGPLHYYPGSHKLHYIMNKDYSNEGSRFFIGPHSYTAYEDKVQEVVNEHQLHRKTFLARKGDLLIWHANLLHGGNPHLNKLKTRKSIVFHYYAKEVICYHEISQRPALMR